MKLVDMSVKVFIDTLASSAPAPGGGSVSALAGANGCGLMAMAGELTFSKKAFKALDKKIQKVFRDTIDIFISHKEKMIEYIDDDTTAFNGLMSAFRMPKNTEEEKEKRRVAIEKSTMETIRVPMEVCQLSIESLRLVEKVMPYANKNTISDQGVAVMMLHNAIEGSAMNVLINLPGLKEEQLVKAYRKEIHLIQEEAQALRQMLLEKIKL
jgi:formiminotetrahydrofolate cyclodeaminase